MWHLGRWMLDDCGWIERTDAATWSYAIGTERQWGTGEMRRTLEEPHETFANKIPGPFQLIRKGRADVIGRTSDWVQPRAGSVLAFAHRGKRWAWYVLVHM